MKGEIAQYTNDRYDGNKYNVSAHIAFNCNGCHKKTQGKCNDYDVNHPFYPTQGDEWRTIGKLFLIVVLSELHKLQSQIQIDDCMKYIGD